jgi:tetratricopeptide (TPR) repeat protein
MMTQEERQTLYDDAMLAFSMAEYDQAIEQFQKILQEDPKHFDAQLSLGMAFYRKEDYARAIQEGHQAQKLKPNEQLVHTNLSLFYMKSGDKKTAEHHGLQARIASWRDDAPSESGLGLGLGGEENPDLKMAGSEAPKPMTFAAPKKFPDMPWKKNKKV